MKIRKIWILFLAIQARGLRFLLGVSGINPFLVLFYAVSYLIINAWELRNKRFLEIGFTGVKEHMGLI